MKPQEIDQILTQTLEDRRLTRTEKQALDQVLADLELTADNRAFWRHRAFAVARETLRQTEAKQVLDWLEGVVKALQPAAAPKESDVSVYFSPGEDCLNCISRLLFGTRERADICVFTITDNRLAKAILDAHERGVQVRIITDDEKALDLGSDAHRLERAGIDVRTDQSEHHMHHKFAVFDQEVVITGSYNWTRSAALHNRENLLMARDPRMVKKFLQAFEGMWEEFKPR